jgi:hypothetical protein
MGLLRPSVAEISDEINLMTAHLIFVGKHLTVSYVGR